MGGKRGSGEKTDRGREGRRGQTGVVEEALTWTTDPNRGLISICKWLPPLQKQLSQPPTFLPPPSLTFLFHYFNPTPTHPLLHRLLIPSWLLSIPPSPSPSFFFYSLPAVTFWFSSCVSPPFVFPLISTPLHSFSFFGFAWRFMAAVRYQQLLIVL